MHTTRLHCDINCLARRHSASHFTHTKYLACTLTQNMCGGGKTPPYVWGKTPPGGDLPHTRGRLTPSFVLMGYSQLLTKYSQLWSSMAKYGQVWSNMVQYSRVWSSMAMHWPSMAKYWPHMVKYGHVWPSMVK